MDSPRAVLRTDGGDLVVLTAGDTIIATEDDERWRVVADLTAMEPKGMVAGGDALYVYSDTLVAEVTRDGQASPRHAAPSDTIHSVAMSRDGHLWLAQKDAGGHWLRRQPVDGGEGERLTALPGPGHIVPHGQRDVCTARPSGRTA